MSTINELTVEEAREYAIAQIRGYALTHGLGGEDIRAIFHAGVGAAHFLRPDIFPPQEEA